MTFNHLSGAFLFMTEKLEAEKVPSSIQEALGNPKKRVVVLEEMRALKLNGTWENVDLPKGKKTLGCKLISTKLVWWPRDLPKLSE